tara:strand:- start:833 stop:1405 length:573 start_codon:yes stop_codon:yes gene_type:complete
MKYKLALFASGSGSNVENIYNFFKDNNMICPSLLICNNKNAYVIERAKKLNLLYKIVESNSKKNSELLSFLKKKKITHLILAGYLKLIEKEIIMVYKNKILNIHPALLPNFGGKGYYGDFVHKSVLDANESKSGITIHLVNEKYDDGKVLFQKEVSIDKSETINSLASKIHNLEYKYYPEIIEKYILNQL